MTTTDRDPDQNIATDKTPRTWTAAATELRTRFPETKDSILFCIHAVEERTWLELGDLKASASAQGIRVTAASLTAARRLLDPKQASPTNSKAVGARKGKQGRPARSRAGDLDPEALIRGVVEKIEQSRNVEADRLRERIPKRSACSKRRSRISDAGILRTCTASS